MSEWQPIETAPTLRGGTFPPATAVDCAGACLTQEVVDFILQNLRDTKGRFAPNMVDIHIRNVSLSWIPTLMVSKSD